ncbi:CRISPR-associated RecB family exonuclease Cas4 [hydrothermal vent metagenome]|uniref:CRISPR-associated exonuclease Cas4 n=1 Tax=hydrothermal vent metagenome TaxID=652676 RepID=A0A3B1DF63_9ZZZZ
MYTDENLIPLSALQHLLFCRRQCALIHVEQLWSENIFTAQGRIMHEKVDDVRRESRNDMRIEYGMGLRSLRLGLIGKADAVEFHKEKKVWTPFPVEHKRGKPKKNNCDKVQLCAQGLCLEEMLGINVPAGALFYGKTRRRLDVVFDEGLRQETESLAKDLHDLINSGITPAAVYEEKCEHCSLMEQCLPKIMDHQHSVEKYFREEIEL